MVRFDDERACRSHSHWMQDRREWGVLILTRSALDWEKQWMRLPDGETQKYRGCGERREGIVKFSKVTPQEIAEQRSLSGGDFNGGNAGLQ